MYMLKKTELPKITRVCLYYIRLVLHGTFASLFSPVGNKRVILIDFFNYRDF